MLVRTAWFNFNFFCREVFVSFHLLPLQGRKISLFRYQDVLQHLNSEL